MNGFLVTGTPCVKIASNDGTTSFKGAVDSTNEASRDIKKGWSGNGLGMSIGRLSK